MSEAGGRLWVCEDGKQIEEKLSDTASERRRGVSRMIVLVTDWIQVAGG